ncbi:MAG: hypothetical protein IT539_18695 [Bradyrhizobiaceae bacterium]|nr:hypothetical protein [Bradyrhizobiaceae bacterium]
MTDIIDNDDKLACKGDYEVGYKKPPKAHQFKPGQSGNHRGRPKGKRNMRSILQEALAAKVKVRDGDKVRTMTKRQALRKFCSACCSD